MNRTSFFIKNKALFGSYPSHESVKELEQEGVRYFIDLTCKGEKGINPYKTSHNYIHFPIKDGKLPNNLTEFTSFIVYISDIITNLPENSLLYLHCKGGHTRSAIVTACLLCYIEKISPIESLRKTSFFHGQRVDMKDKWRRIGAPQTYTQKDFVIKLFEPLRKSKIHDLVTELKQERDIALNLLKTKEDIDAFLYEILISKFKENPDVYFELLRSRLKPIIIDSKLDMKIVEKFIHKIRDDAYRV